MIFYLEYRVKRSPQKFPTTSSNMTKLEYKSGQQIISKNCNYATDIILTIAVADKAVNVKNISGQSVCSQWYANSCQSCNCKKLLNTERASISHSTALT